jgi:hypothetical protein
MSNKTEGVLTGEIEKWGTWTYSGSVLNGLRHGNGKCTWSNGIVCEGEWINGEFVKGKMIGVNRCLIYEGDLYNELPHGKGKMTFADGRVFEGNWANGQPLPGLKLIS